MREVGKIIFFAGLAIAVLGLLLWSGFGRGWLGRLPGDLRIERPGVSIYFPIVTCLLISLALSALLWLFRR